MKTWQESCNGAQQRLLHNSYKRKYVSTLTSNSYNRSISTHTVTHIHVCMHVYTHTYTHTHTHTHTHACMHTYIHAHTHTYIHTFTHTYTHACAHMWHTSDCDKRILYGWRDTKKSEDEIENHWSSENCQFVWMLTQIIYIHVCLKVETAGILISLHCTARCFSFPHVTC